MLTPRPPRRIVVPALVAVFGLVSRAALACPVCFAAKNEENQLAFIATTGLLTFAPLVLIGGLIWWLRHNAVKHDHGPARRTTDCDPAEETGAAGLVTMIAAAIVGTIRLLRRLFARTSPPKPMANLASRANPADTV